ncbi:Uma2 family endonuclease [Desulfovirgula thermocuniculi]|uniref:Uma2 family endonuclease n=1 Tax=Desulfovirgula thermocuniculi TaxID=348842 RepID=UPI000425A7FD|nr:Uma2 family endonuclease [Desulfovirgula thermocuniculi]
MNTPFSRVQIPYKEIYTYADYAQLPEGAPYQLIGGKLVMTPAPTPRHQAILRRLGVKMANFVEEKGTGAVYFAPVDVYLQETEVLQPDIVFISRERFFIIGAEKIEGAPDLVVEILSPSTAYYDLRHKFKVYARCGVKEYWIVDPMEKSIEVYGGEGGRFTLIAKAEGTGKVESRIIEGFAVELEEVFAEMP